MMAVILFALLVSGSAALNVNVVPGLTNITLTWDAYSVANDKLEFKVENDMFARIVECRGQLGRKVIRHLPPRTTYHVTVTLITNDGIWLQRDVVFSTFVTMPKIYIRKYINALRAKRFAKGILFSWTNRTALPHDLEEASMILRVSRDNWTSVFTAPILQHYASITSLTPGCYYKVQFYIGPNSSGAISPTLRPFVGNKLGVLAMPNQKSVVHWESADITTREVTLCATCGSTQTCDVSTDNTFLIRTPPANCLLTLSATGLESNQISVNCDVNDFRSLRIG